MPTSWSISPALDQLADLARGDEELVSDPAVPTTSLVTRLSLVPDRRKRRGLRHELLVVLVLAACATLVVGARPLRADPQEQSAAGAEAAWAVLAGRDADWVQTSAVEDDQGHGRIERRSKRRRTGQVIGVSRGDIGCGEVWVPGGCRTAGGGSAASVSTRSGGSGWVLGHRR